jgi:transcriptional regulator with XRE-family HTH domain
MRSAKPIELRRLREAAVLTQAELAQLAGVRPATVSAIERGTTTPRPGTLRAIADVLHVEPRALLRAAAGADE